MSLVHRDSRSGGSVQETLQVEACQLIIRMLSDLGRKGGHGPRIARLQLGKCLQVTFRGGIVGLLK